MSVRSKAVLSFQLNASLLSARVDRAVFIQEERNVEWSLKPFYSYHCLQLAVKRLVEKTAVCPQYS